MQIKLKMIILASIAVLLIALIIIFNIPYTLNSALNFNESEQILISIVIFENVGGQPIHKAEKFTFEKGSNEFTVINKLLDVYSYNLTTAKDISREASYKVTIISISGDNSSVYLTNFTGSNIIVNGANHRMKQIEIEELIGKILDICGIHI